LEGQILPAILRTDHLVPGAHLTISDRWHATEGPHLTLPAGTYRLRAELLTESGRISTDTVPIRVIAG
jgi:hypothetical protein